MRLGIPRTNAVREPSEARYAFLELEGVGAITGSDIRDRVPVGEVRSLGYEDPRSRKRRQRQRLLELMECVRPGRPVVEPRRRAVHVVNLSEGVQRGVQVWK